MQVASAPQTRDAARLRRRRLQRFVKDWLLLKMAAQADEDKLVKSTHARAGARRDQALVVPPAAKAPQPAPPPLALADEETEALAPSPARVLQDELSARFADDAAEGKWSRRKTLVFMVATCGGFWGLAYWAITSFARR